MIEYLIESVTPIGLTFSAHLRYLGAPPLNVNQFTSYTVPFS
jgi:hypothetical protein